MKEPTLGVSSHISEVVQALPRREPVVSKETYEKLFSANIDRQWTIFSELVRREMQENPSLRLSLSGFAVTPLSEELPSHFLNTVFSVCPHIAERCKNFKGGLIAFLELNAVPNALLSPDIRNAQDLESPEQIIADFDRLMKKLRADPQTDYEKELLERLERARQYHRFTHGVSLYERMLALRRYKYARDVKLFALGAELFDEEIDLDSQKEGVFHQPLSSGIEINGNVEDQVLLKKLLTPAFWEKRIQIKDRVFQIEVEGKKYVLKERKTPYHKDTSSSGGRYHATATAENEFNFARQLHETGLFKKAEFQVSWERPIGYVVYPDGFQFIVTHFEDHLIEDSEVFIEDSDMIVRRAIVAALKRQEDLYRLEYEAVCILMKKFRFDPRVLNENAQSEAFFETYFKAGSELLRRSLSVSFEEFIEVKAQRLIERAVRAREHVMNINNLYDRDRAHQYRFRINETDQQVQLEVIGFDFEYLSRVSDDESRERDQNLRNQYIEDYQRGFCIKRWMTRTQRSAYLAMYVLEEDVDT